MLSVYEGYVVKRATLDLLEEFIEYRKLVALENQSLQYELRKALAEDLIESHNKPNRRGYFILKKDENQDDIIVGELFVSSVDHLSAAVVTKLYVLKTERKNGAGTKLIRTMEEDISRSKCKAVSVHREEITAGFFNKLGFKKVPLKEAGNFLIRDIFTQRRKEYI